MTKRVEFKKKVTQVYFTPPATFDIEGFNISQSDVDAIISRLEVRPAHPDDRVNGTVRYRLIKGYEVIFQLTSTQDEFMIDVCGIRPPEEPSNSAKVKEAIEKIGAVRGALGV